VKRRAPPARPPTTTRHPKALVLERTRDVHRLDKALQDAASAQLSGFGRLGVSGRAMRAGLVEDPRDPAVLAVLANGQLRKKLPQLREALGGRFHAHDALLTGELLAPIEHLEVPATGSPQEVDRHLAFRG
jgi:hypothetical protein